MQGTQPESAHWATSDAGLWRRWRGYAVRWLLFGEIVQLFQTVNDPDSQWGHRFDQALIGLLFGSVCAVVFTMAENTLNASRVKWKSWAIVVATWVVVKVVFVSVMSAAGW